MPLIQVVEVLIVGPSVAGESLRPNGSVHQVDFERRCGDWRGLVALECFWTLSFHLQDAHWERLKYL
jgi:hypothetical protein